MDTKEAGRIGALRRWGKMTKKQRSEAMSKANLKGWATRRARKKKTEKPQS